MTDTFRAGDTARFQAIPPPAMTRFETFNFWRLRNLRRNIQTVMTRHRVSL